MNSQAITTLVQGLVIVFCLQISVFFAEAAENCKNPAGTLVSLQGQAQIQRAGQPGWQPAAMEATFCPGDMLRVNADGRAAVVLANETILRVDRNSTLTFPKPSADSRSLLELLRGVLHIFSHRPHSLDVITPYVNGAVEGTEFLVRVDQDAATITVFTGLVVAANAQGKLSLTDGQSAMATKDAAPQAIAVVRPRDAVEWTLYYPTIVEDSAATPDHARLLGRINEALSSGRVDEARKALAEILQNNPEDGEALALSSIIETVRNNKDRALELARQAIGRSPDSAACGLALSYAYQAQFNIAEARKVLHHAAAANPQNGLVKARLAEVLLAGRELDQALTMASEAASLAPSSGLSWTVLGFTHLSRIEVDEAVTSFSRAIALDPVLPLARLGLGIAKIRRGKLEEGRADIEIAAALDPGNALVRSYLGKAYFEEKRDSQARRQYEIAKELDPADPTPWLYDAVRKQTENRPVEALHDIQQSIALNDNRAVYRSRLLLDDDLAARSAGLGRIYTDLGFEQLARVEGAKSLQADPANYSAHRFLADTYSALPLHEVSRVSELLKSQLLQPLNITPVQPQLAESNLSILDGTGPSSASANEFNSLFLRDRTAFQASGVAGSNGTFGNEVTLSGVEGRVSYSFGQFHHQTDGIRENDDLKQNIYSGFLQAMLSPTTSLMTEVRYKDRKYGDIASLFDPTENSKTLRQSDETKSMRVGMRHDLSPNSTVLGTGIVSTRASDTDEVDYDTYINTKVESRMMEAQHIYRGERFNLQTGAGHYYGAQNFATKIHSIDPPIDFFSERINRTDHSNLYSYAQIYFPEKFTSIVGLSGDWLITPRGDRNELNPKLGLTWQPAQGTLFRAAAFKAVARNLINAQTIEPTMVAGFNQFFDDFDATMYWTYGAGVDHKFSSEWYGGLQYYRRLLNVPWVEVTETIMVNREDDWKEGVGSAYLYWVVSNRVTLGLDYFYELYDHDQLGGGGFHQLITNRLTPKILLFFPSGFSAKLQTSYIDQQGQIYNTSSDDYHSDGDHFWVVDFAISYRLPKRYGIFRIEVRNLFDKHFKFLDTDPASPRFLPEQQFLCSLTLTF